jgi:hypothetical protein
MVIFTIVYYRHICYHNYIYIVNFFTSLAWVQTSVHVCCILHVSNCTIAYTCSGTLGLKYCTTPPGNMFYFILWWAPNDLVPHWYYDDQWPPGQHSNAYNLKLKFTFMSSRITYSWDWWYDDLRSPARVITFMSSGLTCSGLVIRWPLASRTTSPGRRRPWRSIKEP